MNKKIDLPDLHIAVADDHQLMLEGLHSLLARNGITAVCLFRSAAELLGSLHAHSYHIYIVDLEMPDMDGFALIRAIRRVQPEARIIVNTIHDELWTVRRLVALQVDGILFKSLDAGLLMEAIRAIAGGGRYYCREVQAALDMMDAKGMEHPSQREMDVLRAISQGLTSREIADRLFISENTVEAHRKSLFTKLNVRNLADLVMKAIRRGYLE